MSRVDKLKQCDKSNTTIFHTQFAFDDVVAREWNATTAGLGETSLVNKVAHTLQVGVSPGDIRLTDAEHVKSSLKDLKVSTLKLAKLNLKNLDQIKIEIRKSSEKVTLFSLTKTPLLICLSLKSWRVLRTLGLTWLILQNTS